MTTPHKSPRALRALKTVCAAAAAVVLLAWAGAFATPQIPDKIIYEGKEYPLYAFPMEPFFKKFPEKRPKGFNSALVRGYLARYEVVNKELILKDILNNQKNIESILNTIFSGSQTRGKALKADWYTGTLALGVGKALCADAWYGIVIREHHLLLEFENGNLIKETRIDYLEYLEYLYTKRDTDYLNLLRYLLSVL